MNGDFVAGLGLGLLVGAVGTAIFFARLLIRLREEGASLQTEVARLRERNAGLEEKVASERATIEKLESEFKLAASQALKEANEIFLSTAVRDLRQVHTEADADIKGDKKEIAGTVSEMKEKLDNYERLVRKFEEERSALYGKFEKSLEQVLSAGERMAAEALSLKRVFSSSSGVRGLRGEWILKEIFEQNSLVEGIHFHSQVALQSEMGNEGRPDFVIQLPKGGRLAVDAKEVSAEYDLAQNTDDPQAQKMHYDRLVTNIRQNFLRLSRKEYQSTLDPSVPFVIMFISSEGAIRAAFETEPDIFKEAWSRKVILASPMTLMPLIFLIFNAWQQYTLTENARELGGVVEELGNRLFSFVSHLKGIRDGIQKSADSWDRAVGSWDRKVAPQLEKVKNLGGKLKETEEITPVNVRLRQTELEAPDDPVSVS